LSLQSLQSFQYFSSQGSSLPWWKMPASSTDSRKQEAAGKGVEWGEVGGWVGGWGHLQQWRYGGAEHRQTLKAGRAVTVYQLRCLLSQATVLRTCMSSKRWHPREQLGVAASC
jgi:hypothetical protein